MLCRAHAGGIPGECRGRRCLRTLADRFGIGTRGAIGLSAGRCPTGRHVGGHSGRLHPGGMDQPAAPPSVAPADGASWAGPSVHCRLGRRAITMSLCRDPYSSSWRPPHSWWSCASRSGSSQKQPVARVWSRPNPTAEKRLRLPRPVRAATERIRAACPQLSESSVASPLARGRCRALRRLARRPDPSGD